MNLLRGAALGIWLLWVGCIIFFPNWQQAAENEKDYRKDLGVHFLLKPPAPVAVPCYFVGCIAAPPSYFHVLIDRKGFYPALLCVTALLILALVILRNEKNRSIPDLTTPRKRLVVASLIALALPLPGAPFMPLGSLAAYLPTALLHPNHDHISVLIAAPLFFALYSGLAYSIICAAVWANRMLRP